MKFFSFFRVVRGLFILGERKHDHSFQTLAPALGDFHRGLQMLELVSLGFENLGELRRQVLRGFARVFRERFGDIQGVFKRGSGEFRDRFHGSRIIPELRVAGKGFVIWIRAIRQLFDDLVRNVTSTGQTQTGS